MPKVRKNFKNKSGIRTTYEGTSKKSHEYCRWKTSGKPRSSNRKKFRIRIRIQKNRILSLVASFGMNLTKFEDEPQEEVASCINVPDLTCPFTECGVRVTKEFFDKFCNSSGYVDCSRAKQLIFNKNSDSKK